MGGLPELLGVQRIVSIGAGLPGVGLDGWFGRAGPAVRRAGLQAMSARPSVIMSSSVSLFILIVNVLAQI